MKLKQSWFLTLSLVYIPLLAVATFPGRGGYEGGQREIEDFSQKIDWWGFATPFLYGKWPNQNGYWNYSLGIIQISIYWLGIYLIFKNTSLTIYKKNWILHFFIFSGVLFSFQLWRDSTLFSLLTLCVGLNYQFLRTRSFSKKIFIIIFSSIILLIAGLFKVIFMPVYILIFSYPFIYKKSIKYFLKNNFIILIILILTVPLPYLIDKKLISETHMTKSYPEQQPMIYDLSAISCWGIKESDRQNALLALQPFLKENYPKDSICAFMRTNDWGSLVQKTSRWEYSPPLNPIKHNDQDSFHILQFSWLRTITNSPQSWLTWKSQTLFQSITMSGAITSGANSRQPISNSLAKFSDVLWKLIITPFKFLDSIRLYSVIGILFSLLLLLNRKGKYFTQIETKFSFPKVGSSWLILILGILISLESVAFVASNGRYIFGLIVLLLINLFVTSSEEFSRGDRN